MESDEIWNLMLERLGLPMAERRDVWKLRDRIMLQAGATDITLKTLRRFLSGKWIDSSAIEWHMHNCAQNVAAERVCLLQDWVYSRVINPHRTEEELCRILDPTIYDRDVILFVANINQNHWTLVVIRVGSWATRSCLAVGFTT